MLKKNLKSLHVRPSDRQSLFTPSMINVDSESEINPYNDSDILENIFSFRLVLGVIRHSMERVKQKTTKIFGQKLKKKKQLMPVLFFVEYINLSYKCFFGL